MAIKRHILLEKLQQLRKQKKSASFYAQKLGVGVDIVYELLDELKNKHKETEEQTKEVNVEKGEIKSSIEISFDPTTIEELYKLHKVDKTRFKITNYWSKLKANGKFTSSIFAKLLKEEDYTPEDFANFLKDYTPKPIKVSKVKDLVINKKPLIDVELSIADFHLDRRTLKNDTIEERKEEYKKAVDDLINKIKGAYRIRHLVFVIGNDYFNTDNYHNQTTNFTPQEISTPWHKAYEEGFDLLVEVLTKLSFEAERVTVILIQGNHDRTKSFYLAHALEVFFKSFTNITFQRENSNTKYIILGNTFIGYHHGNHVKIDSLPLYFQNEEKSSFAYGSCKYREVHTGDKHHYMAKDVQSVRIQQIPSMVDIDNYTNDGLYLHVKAAVAFCYDPVKGRVAEFEYRI
jgi:hypothetical protein